MMDHNDCTGLGRNFFDVFEFIHLMHDAIDCGLVYEGITILRDIETASGKVLKKGSRYDAVWFMFRESEFRFIRWKQVSQDGQQHINGNLLFIQQHELAPFLMWDMNKVKG